MTPVFVNGRFAVQAQSGVQRFASEIVAALPSAWPGERTLPTLLLPPNAPDGRYPLPTRRVGQRRGGVAWEQLDLPRHASRGLLVSLGNTGPVLAGHQLVVIHDAAVHARPEAYSWKFKAWYRLLQPALVRRGASIATVSEFSRSELSRYLGVSSASIALLPEGGEHILRVPADGGVLAVHGLRPGRFVLVVGNLAAHKNLAALGETARALASRGFDLVVTGSLDRAVFGTLAGLPEPARYVGRVDDASLRALYEAASCFLFPSLYEGFGLPVLEAMACGCPVALSDIPALREVAGGAARYFDPRHPHDIARAVCEVVDDPAMSDLLRHDGNVRLNRFGWAKAAGALYDLLDGLLASRPGYEGVQGMGEVKA